VRSERSKSAGEGRSRVCGFWGEWLRLAVEGLGVVLEGLGLMLRRDWDAFAVREMSSNSSRKTSLSSKGISCC